MIKPIVTWPNSILKKDSLDIAIFGEPLEGLLTDMWDTLMASGGVGLSAVQIGMPVKCFILDSEAFTKINVSTPFDGRGRVDFVNPKVLSESKETDETWEGCLSFPDIYLKFERPKVIKLSYQDKNGDPQELEATDFLARAIMHEYDHLNGVLMTKYVGSLKRQMVEKKLLKRRRP